MKKLLLLLFMMLCLSAYSQNKDLRFAVIKTGNKYSKEMITTAFQKADMCGHYYISKSNDIIFDDGSVVRLFSKNEMSQMSPLSDNCFLADDSVALENIVWSITSDGNLVKKLISQIEKEKNLDKMKVSPEEFYIINDKPVDKLTYLKHLKTN